MDPILVNTSLLEMRNDTFYRVDHYLFRFVLRFVVIVAKPSISAFPPSVQAAILQDAGTVRGATSNKRHLLPSHCLHQLWGVLVTTETGRKMNLVQILFNSITYLFYSHELFTGGKVSLIPRHSTYVCI